MISKTKAIAVLEELKGDCTGQIAMTIEDCQKVIGKMEDDGWIPVTKRLPEDDLPKDSTAKQIKVLVAYKRGNCSWVIRTQLRQKGRWYGRPNEWDWSVSEPISYWMPLPEPPKEAQG